MTTHSKAARSTFFMAADDTTRTSRTFIAIKIGMDEHTLITSSISCFHTNLHILSQITWFPSVAVIDSSEPTEMDPSGDSDVESLALQTRDLHKFYGTGRNALHVLRGMNTDVPCEHLAATTRIHCILSANQFIFIIFIYLYCTTSEMKKNVQTNHKKNNNNNSIQ